MKNPLNKIKPEVRGLSPYTLRQYEHELKLNQNENPFDVPTEIKDELLGFARKRSWSRYPDFVPEDLLERLAQYVGWDKEGILVGNGSNELIQAILMVSTEKGSRVVIPVPTFTLYELMSTISGAEVIEVNLKADYTFDIDAIEKAVTSRSTALLFLASPNNPTGCIISNEDLEKILQKTDALVVVDEAYHEFSGTTCLPLLRRYRNLIVLRTFSKAFSLAGLRVGYLITHPELAGEISKAKLPYNLNFFSQAAAMKVLESRAALQERIEYLKMQREIVYDALLKIPGVKPYPSQANFILFETRLDAKYLFSRLLQHGVLIRDVSGYPMLSRALRVTIGKEEENQRLVQILREVVHAVD